MADEKIIINCIIPTAEMAFHTNLDSIESIMREVLHLGCYITQFSSSIQSKLSDKYSNSSSKFSRIYNNEHIFEFLDDPEFWRDLRKLANGFETLTNIHIIKVCMYLSIELLAVYFNTYALLDTESMRNGVKQDVNLLFRSLVMANRYLPLKFISMWIEHNRPLINDSRVLSPDEYLILASNSFNKQKLIKERIPNVEITILKDKKTGTFLLENQLQVKPDLDLKLEKIMSLIPASMIGFDYTYKPDVFIKEKHPPARKKQLQLLETRNFKNFQSSLKDPSLILKLKQTLSNASLMLNRTKINSENFSYMNYRSSSGFINGISTLAKSAARNDSAVLASHQMFEIEMKAEKEGKKARPQTSRPMLVRPISSASIISPRKKMTRPLTGRPGSKHMSALTLGIKDEPYHVMSLRETVSSRSERF